MDIFFSKEDPQIKLQMVWLIELVNCFGKEKHYIMCIGREERTDLASVVHPAKLRNLDFQELSLDVIELRIGWKSWIKGFLLRMGNPRYFPNSGLLGMSRIEVVSLVKQLGQDLEKKNLDLFLLTDSPLVLAKVFKIIFIDWALLKEASTKKENIINEKGVWDKGSLIRDLDWFPKTKRNLMLYEHG